MLLYIHCPHTHPPLSEPETHAPGRTGEIQDRPEWSLGIQSIPFVVHLMQRAARGVIKSILIILPKIPIDLYQQLVDP